jgi:hypothetical protein
VQVKAGEGFDSYSWSTGSTEHADTISMPEINGLDSMIIVSCNLGMDSYTDTVVLTSSIPEHVENIEICIHNGDSIELVAGTGVEYLWYRQGGGGIVMSTEQSIFAKENGCYYVEVFNEMGCSVSDTFYVSTRPREADLSLYQDSTICAGDEIRIFSSDVWTYNWSTGEEETYEIMFSRETPGSYDISCEWTETDVSSGREILCETSDTATIHVIECENALGELSQAGIIVYPNPASDRFTVVSEYPVRVKMYSMEGELIMQTEEVTRETIMRVDGLPRGMYIVKLEGESGYYSQTLLLE